MTDPAARPAPKAAARTPKAATARTPTPTGAAPPGAPTAGPTTAPAGGPSAAPTAGAPAAPTAGAPGTPTAGAPGASAPGTPTADLPAPGSSGPAEAAVAARTADLVAGPGGVMTDEVGVVTGELTLRTELSGGQVALRVQYKDADEWYAVTGGRAALADPADLDAVHTLVLALLHRPEG